VEEVSFLEAYPYLEEPSCLEVAFSYLVDDPFLGVASFLVGDLSLVDLDLALVASFLVNPLEASFQELQYLFQVQQGLEVATILMV